MIAATVGRIVWFKASKDSVEVPAIVSEVDSPSMISVTVFDSDGPRFESSVPLEQEEDVSGVYVTRYCMWMPYQQKAAAKYPV